MMIHKIAPILLSYLYFPPHHKQMGKKVIADLPHPKKPLKSKYKEMFPELATHQE